MKNMTLVELKEYLAEMIDMGEFAFASSIQAEIDKIEDVYKEKVNVEIERGNENAGIHSLRSNPI